MKIDVRQDILAFKSKTDPISKYDTQGLTQIFTTIPCLVKIQKRKKPVIAKILVNAAYCIVLYHKDPRLTKMTTF